jgi:hypothetical protein
VYDPEKPLPRPRTHGQEQTWVASQPELMRHLDGMGLLPQHFQWEIAETTFEGLPALTADGLAKVYCIMQPLTENGRVFNPAVEDERYYAAVQ